ncbi:MAG: hypothetical protein DYH08_14735 [Actinobacteria bacterium ATB1]|nr:hypothetical protein [Actinobacteria bacterium ATB1]
MIELHVLGLSEDGDQILLAAHPEAEVAGYAVAVSDRLRELAGVGAGASESASDDLIEADVGEPEPEPEPMFELPAGPLEVGNPAEALETAHGLHLLRMPAGSGTGSNGTSPVTSGDEGEAGEETVEPETAEAGNGGETPIATMVPMDAVSDLGLHDSVLANLHRWNVRIPTEVLDEGWFVTKLGDQAWQISFRFLSRGRIHEAEWVLDTTQAVLVPENDLAAMLGWWKPERPRRPRRRRGGRGRRRNSGRRRTGASS